MSRVVRTLRGIHEERRWVPEPVVEPEAPPPPIDTEAIVSEVRREAEREAISIVATARREADKLGRQAYEEGRELGRQLGLQEYEKRVEAIETLVAEVNREREDFFRRMEPELVRLATAIAEKVLAHQLTVKPETIVDLTRAQMKRIREREVIGIRANPEDVPLLSAEKPALMSEVDGVREIHLFDDRRVSRGSMVLETPHGSLDARLPNQLDIVRQALDDALEANHESSGY